jgi:hypothetical protein
MSMKMAVFWVVTQCSNLPLIESDITECLNGGIPVLMAGDLNAQHKTWYSRLTTARGSLLHD